MKLLTALIISFAISSASAAAAISADPGRYPLPKDLPDGMYIVRATTTGAGVGVKTLSDKATFELVAAYGTEEWFGNATAVRVANPSANAARAYPPLYKRFPGAVEYGLLSCMSIVSSYPSNAYNNQ